MIVKIQRQLSYEPEKAKRRALIYNQSRSLYAEFHLKDVEHLFNDNALKVYHKARLTKSTQGIASLPTNNYNLSVSMQHGTVEDRVATVGVRLIIGKCVRGQTW